MKIHLITVAFNAAHTIGDTIDSVKQQEGGDFEYRIQDGGSKDETVKVVDEKGFGNFVSVPDKGLYDALNKAVAAVAEDDIIGFIHADDVLAYPTTLQDILVCFQENPEVEAVYSDLQYVSQDLKKVVRKWRSGKQKSMATGWMPPHPTLYVKKSAFNRIGEFRLDIGSAADYEWMLRAIHVHKLALHYLPKTTVKMRVGGMSNADLKARQSGLKNDLKAWQVNTGKSNYTAVILKKLRKLPQYL